MRHSQAIQDFELPWNTAEHYNTDDELLAPEPTPRRQTRRAIIKVDRVVYGPGGNAITAGIKYGQE